MSQNIEILLYFCILNSMFEYPSNGNILYNHYYQQKELDMLENQS